jgi:hypothetical protein
MYGIEYVLSLTVLRKRANLERLFQRTQHIGFFDGLPLYYQ